MPLCISLYGTARIWAQELHEIQRVHFDCTQHIAVLFSIDSLATARSFKHVFVEYILHN